MSGLGGSLRLVPLGSEATSVSSEQPIAETTPAKIQPTSDGNRERGNPGDPAPPSQQATVPVRGETVRDQEITARPKDSPSKDKENALRKVSEAKVRLQSRLPALDDDADVGVQKEQRVTRDGKADLSFTGKRLASAA